MDSRARARLALLLFLITWLLGSVALRIGLDLGADLPAAGIFGVACVLWWISYKISDSAEGRGMMLGFVALGFWMLNLIAALVFAFHHNVADLVFLQQQPCCCF